MDAFGDGNFEQSEIDPAAEFLAREQNALAGLEDEIPPLPTGPVDDDVTQPKAELTGSFEMINNDVDVGGLPDYAAALDTGVGFNQEEEDGNDDFSGYTVPKQVTEEPERIRKWREEQKTRLEEKDREEERKKEELREQARKELEDWYKHHEEAISKTKAANRNAEKQFVAETDEIEPGTEWERIAKLCDFNPKTNKSSKDISRMRSIILQLKQNPISTNKKV
ncbi:clathrin light chain isoform X2 [Topomyia yanbarensis]|uniref:clathrin light chain isoform X2 n=1 Tax=Topomyia yanbarensis TaxID=2498891 RepID=UPI00273CE0D9|nr:clathrin light chain isoform X2 [Topomyia yanbarensis]